MMQNTIPRNMNITKSSTVLGVTKYSIDKHNIIIVYLILSPRPINALSDNQPCAASSNFPSVC